MTFPAPVSMSFDAGRAQFVADIGRRLEQLEKSESPIRNFLQARAELQRILGRLQWATDEEDYLEARRHLLTLVAQCYRTAACCNVLTEQAAVAATEAATRHLPTSKH